MEIIKFASWNGAFTLWKFIQVKITNTGCFSTVFFSFFFNLQFHQLNSMYNELLLHLQTNNERTAIEDKPYYCNNNNRKKKKKNNGI